MSQRHQPEVSVIVPNYNHAAYLDQRLESILRQEYQNFEIIILDDCSPDDSRSVIERYRGHPAVTAVIMNTENSGSTFRQWQRGLGLAKGEYCWIAESDDFASPAFLSRLLPLLQAGADMAYANSTIVDARGQALSIGLEAASWLSPKIDRKDFQRDYRWSGAEELRRHLVYSNTMYNASAIVIRKRVLQAAVDGLERFRLYGDWLAWIRCAAGSREVAYCAEPLNNFRTHGGNVRSDMARRYEQQLQELSAMRAEFETLAGNLDGASDLIAVSNVETRRGKRELIQGAAERLGAGAAFSLMRRYAGEGFLDAGFWKPIVAALVRGKRS